MENFIILAKTKFMKELFIFLFVIYFHVLFAQQQGSFLDSRDGKLYKTIQIGEQLWMAENLNFVTDSGSWCYDESNENCALFGRLYDFSSAQTVCPEGWQLPSKKDVQTLFQIVGEDNTAKALSMNGSSGFDAMMGGWRGEYKGSYHKGSETRFWTSSKGNSLNSWYFGIYETQNIVRLDYDSRGLGLYVRCMKISE